MKRLFLFLAGGALLVFCSSRVLAHDRPDVTGSIGGPAIESATTLFLSVPPETLLATKPNRPRKFITPVRRWSGRYPNWANLRNETVAQGGFQPASSQSDSAGGMRIGVSFMRARRPGHINPKWKPIHDSARVYCWVRLTEWKWFRQKGAGADLIPKTLRSQGVIFHTGPARGLDSTGVPGDSLRVPLRRERKKLEPIRSSNRLFPEIVALKLNIAMSELGKTPAGFGDLIFDRDQNFLDELTVRAIAAKADTMMTRWQLYTQIQYDSLWSAISAINRAFAGPLDTLTWLAANSLHPQGNLTVRGQVDIATVPFLRLPVPFIPTLMAATTYDVEDDPVFGDEEFSDDSDDDEGVPVSVAMLQNYPNPFNPATTIAFHLSEAARVTIRVLDILGREVAVLVEGEEMDGGSQSVLFDGENLATGVYFCRITLEGLEGGSARTVTSGKMLLMK
jgi:hypothetical protein